MKIISQDGKFYCFDSLCTYIHPEENKNGSWTVLGRNRLQSEKEIVMAEYSSSEKLRRVMQMMADQSCEFEKVQKCELGQKFLMEHEKMSLQDYQTLKTKYDAVKEFRFPQNRAI